MFRLSAVLLLAPVSGTQVRKVNEFQQQLDMNLLYSMVPGGRNATAEQLKAWQQWRPCAACKEYVRLGELHDGGYVMCAELLKGHAKAIYSYGIKGFDGWAADVSERLGGAVVEQYDCFNLNRPVCPTGKTCNFKFHEECIAEKRYADKEGRMFGTLRQHIARNGHLHSDAVDMVMKMDVEGAEWAALAADEAKEVLKRFSQVVLEFHGADAPQFGVRAQALKNMLELFEVVHIHANNCCQPRETADGYVVPQNLEVSFVRKGLVQKTACNASPVDTPLDHRNVVAHPPALQIKLGPQ